VTDRGVTVVPEASVARVLLAALDARDRFTAGHSVAVAVYAHDIAAELSTDAADPELAMLAGWVHDVGKIGLPAGLLEKPGALTVEERREMQRHPEIGERILASAEGYRFLAGVVRHHHERVDGGGYPDGLSADQIPLLSRIVGVAEAYSWMTADLFYRAATPTRVARLQLARHANSQFDPTVVEAFEALLARMDEDYRLARAQQFELRIGTD
jgi:HD-GYP domain-containing protein (c-di-GMP phosphodiesterase class II)